MGEVLGYRLIGKFLGVTRLEFNLGKNFTDILNLNAQLIDSNNSRLPKRSTQ
jgi:hypothetical protein